MPGNLCSPSLGASVSPLEKWAGGLDALPYNQPGSYSNLSCLLYSLPAPSSCLPALACPHHEQVGALWISLPLASLYLLGKTCSSAVAGSSSCFSSAVYSCSRFGDCTRLLELDLRVNLGGPLMSCVTPGQVTLPLCAPIFSSPKWDNNRTYRK